MPQARQGLHQPLFQELICFVHAPQTSGNRPRGALSESRMNIRVRIAVMSHLSDAQAMLDFNLKKEATNEINLAKAILLAYPNTDDWTTEKELNEITSQVK